MGAREEVIDAGPAPGGTRRVGLYCVLMVLVYAIATQGVAGVAVQFLYKERFHLSASQTSLVSAATGAPMFVGFLFGFVRDRVRLRGWGDRGYLLAGALGLAGCDLLLAVGEASLTKMVALFLAQAVVGALMGAAYRGMLAAVSKEHGLTGRLSVAGYVLAQAVGIFSQSAGGWIDGRFGYRAAFLASAALTLPLVASSFWRPWVVFPTGDEAFATVVPEGAGSALRRLVRHRAAFFPAIILFLWDFVPGWGTPLLYYLTNGPQKHGVGLSEAQYGTSQSIGSLGALLASLAYLGLCRRFNLRTLLVVGTIVGVLGCPLFLLIHGAALAYGVLFVAGASCGLAGSSFTDLLYRSCPKELEGVTAMLTASATAVATASSDIFGSWLYDRGGFGLALAFSALFSALILPVIAFVPRSVTAPPEGERLVDADPPLGDAVLAPA